MAAARCLQVRLTRQFGVERRETSGRPQQQRRSVATALLGEPHLCPQPLKPRPLQLVERADRRGRQSARLRPPGRPPPAWPGRRRALAPLAGPDPD